MSVMKVRRIQELSVSEHVLTDCLKLSDSDSGVQFQFVISKYSARMYGIKFDSTVHWDTVWKSRSENILVNQVFDYFSSRALLKFLCARFDYFSSHTL